MELLADASRAECMLAAKKYGRVVTGVVGFGADVAAQ